MGTSRAGLAAHPSPRARGWVVVTPELSASRVRCPSRAAPPVATWRVDRADPRNDPADATWLQTADTMVVAAVPVLWHLRLYRSARTQGAAAPGMIHGREDRDALPAPRAPRYGSRIADHAGAARRAAVLHPARHPRFARERGRGAAVRRPAPQRFANPVVYAELPGAQHHVGTFFDRCGRWKSVQGGWMRFLEWTRATTERGR